MATLSALVSGLDAELRRLGPRTRRWSGIGAAGAAWRGSSLSVASPTSSLTTCPNGTKIPDCLTGSPNFEPSTPKRGRSGRMCYAQRSIPGPALTTPNRPTLHIIQHCS